MTRIKFFLRIKPAYFLLLLITIRIQFLPIDYMHFERASKYFDYFNYLINKEVKLRDPMDCYACGDLHLELEEMGRHGCIDGIMKLFREESAEGYFYEYFLLLLFIYITKAKYQNIRTIFSYEQKSLLNGTMIIKEEDFQSHFKLLSSIGKVFYF